MAKIVDLLQAGLTFSFELMPPRSAEGELRLEEALVELDELEPSFVSITYGAAGSARQRTHEFVYKLLSHQSYTPMAHLTTAAHTRDELADIIRDYSDVGLQNILALRGDPPLSSNGDVVPGELTRAVELVELIREVGDFCVAVAMHPEGHPQETSRSVDRQRQANKLSVGDFGITQFFFDANDYERLVSDMQEDGIDKPIIPGIMPPTHFSQLEKMSGMSGAHIPLALANRLEAAGDDLDEAHKIGVEVATKLCSDLLDKGAPGLHFYTMNRSTATREIYKNLGLRSKVKPA